MSAASAERTSGAPSLAVVIAPFLVAVIALAFGAFPFGGDALVAAFVGAVLVVLVAIDLDRGEVPNRIVLPATAVVLAARIAITPHHAVEYALGALLAAAGLALPRVFNRRLLGAGDPKLALLSGAAVGWQVGWAIALAFMLLFPVALVVLIRGGRAARGSTIPLSPFLAAGTLIVLLGPGLT
jgi:prepilin signal peptidase PulO-like enzyme (type II secretory pathway)